MNYYKVVVTVNDATKLSNTFGQTVILGFAVENESGDDHVEKIERLVLQTFAKHLQLIYRLNEIKEISKEEFDRSIAAGIFLNDLGTII